MDKYPRTFHLPFSPEIHSDDKVCNILDLNYIIENKIEVVITTKFDGGNCCLSEEGIYARSHSQQTQCPSFDYIKGKHYYPNIGNFGTLKIFGENMYAEHSIKYDKLEDYFYMFNVLDTNDNIWLSWDEVKEYGNLLDFCIVDEVYRGTIKNLKWLEDFLKYELNQESSIGGEREGFVIRNSSSFSNKDFSKNVFKFVRANHVQTDVHWSKNWKPNKLKK